MPRRAKKVPSYCLHKASGQAVVRVDGRDVYLGRYGSPESHEAYERTLYEWRLGGVAQKQVESQLAQSAASLTVEDLLARYFQHACVYYVTPEGKPSREFHAMRYAARGLRRLYGKTLARELGPIALKSIQRNLVDQGTLARQEINRRISRIRRILRWAVGEQLLPPAVLVAIETVAPLRHGRTEAREAPPIGTAPLESVNAVLGLASPPIAAMIRLQLLTGMRPGEVVRMRLTDIDRSESVWVYAPETHKNQWRGQRREVFLGPECQRTLEPFLDRPPGEYLFSPAEAEEWRSLQRRRARQTPLTPSQVGRRRKPRPKRAKRQRYDVDSYRRAIEYAIDKVNRTRLQNSIEPIPAWSPLQLRHTRATEIRKIYGLEGSQVTLGHKHAAITEVYAERNRELAMRIAHERG